MRGLSAVEAIRDENMQIIGYRQQGSDGRVNIRNKQGELVGWTALGQTRVADGRLLSFQEREGLIYKYLK